MTPANQKVNYDEYFKRQGGLCALCHKPLNSLRRFNYLDHDHKTNTMRGLLHHMCNRAIGGVEAALELVTYADIIKYLRPR